MRDRCPACPSPTGLPSILTTGMTMAVAAVMKASRAAFASATVNGRSSTFRPLARGKVDDDAAGDAAQDVALGRGA